MRDVGDMQVDAEVVEESLESYMTRQKFLALHRREGRDFVLAVICIDIAQQTAGYFLSKVLHWNVFSSSHSERNDCIHPHWTN